jgi:hypothetical protein
LGFGICGTWICRVAPVDTVDPDESAADELEGAPHLDASVNECRPAEHAAHDGGATNPQPVIPQLPHGGHH